VILLFIGGALSIAISISGWPAFREHSFSLAAWLLVLAIANFTMQCLENATWMLLLTFSQEHATAVAGDANIFHVTGMAVRMIWKWVHYTHLLVMVSWMLLLSVNLWRSQLVPRVLALLLGVGCLLQISGISLPQFIPYPTPPMMLMGVPLGLIYLSLAAWLLAKGFATQVTKTTG
jgi:hypothetical protein